MKKIDMEVMCVFLSLVAAAGIGIIGFLCFLNLVEDVFFRQAGRGIYEESAAGITGKDSEGTDDMELLEAYQRRNGDVVGIIRIADSVLNHPLVQTPKDEEYYLKRDLDKKYNSHGVPFLSADSRMESIGQNIVIYGHNIHLKSRDVFCDLAYYEDLDYYKAHPVIETISESGIRHWLIFAYFLTDNADKEPFRYSDYTRFSAEAEFHEFLEEVDKRNWLNVNADAEYGDSLITLSSCSNELAGSGTNRMVVVGKLLKEDEDFMETVNAATMAENPLLPEKLEKHTE